MAICSRLLVKRVKLSTPNTTPLRHSTFWHLPIVTRTDRKIRSFIQSYFAFSALFSAFQELWNARESDYPDKEAHFARKRMLKGWFWRNSLVRMHANFPLQYWYSAGYSPGFITWLLFSRQGKINLSLCNLVIKGTLFLMPFLLSLRFMKKVVVVGLPLFIIQSVFDLMQFIVFGPRNEHEEQLASVAKQSVRLVRTEKGMLGMACRLTQVGDIICLLAGCTVPVILRKVYQGAQIRYKVVAKSFVYLSEEDENFYHGFTADITPESRGVFFEMYQ
jgi:hypothetical protein